MPTATTPTVADAVLALDRAALHEIAVSVRDNPTAARLLAAAKAATVAADHTRIRGVAEYRPDGGVVLETEVHGARRTAARICADAARGL